jgi:PAS domain S-box-containing protein
MKRPEYSFLDLTVLPFLRRKVLSGDATILFSEDFSRVIWANAVGTDLFGGRGIADLLESRLSDNHSLVKQFRNAALQLENSEPLVRGFRISRGLKSELIQGELSKMQLPNGRTAVLLVCNNERRILRENELAEMAVSALEGFADAAAIVDEYGLVLASSSRFDRLEIDPDQLQELVKTGSEETDRLVKRPLTTSNGGVLAAGLGRIRDVPGRYLVVFAETDANGSEPGESEPDGVESATDEDDVAGIVGTLVAGETASDEADTPPWQFHEGINPDRKTDDDKRPEDDDDKVGNKDMHRTDAATNTRHGSSLLDRWYFADDADKEKPVSTSADGERNDPVVQAEPAGNPDENSDIAEDASAIENPEKQATAAGDKAAQIRFAFTVDRDQVIQSVSGELAEIVGEISGNIVGRKWGDLAQERKFDENGIISALLAKADTWSGKSVLWPLDGTDMVVPVDLAALPVFDRERQFEGFRGFGIIRSDDMIVDPMGTGLDLSASGSAMEQEQQDPDETGEAESADISLNQAWQNDADVRPDPAGPQVEEPANSNVVNLRRLDKAAPTRAASSEPAGGISQAGQDLEEAEVDNENALNPREWQNFREIRQKLTGRKTSGPEQTHTSTKSDTVLENLPVPLLIYTSGETLFANDALLQLSGYASLEELADAGGIEALFDEAPDGDQASGIHLMDKNANAVPVDAKLTRTMWQGKKALCLSLAPTLPSGKARDEKLALDMVQVSELENILETAADGIVVVAANGNIESINAAGEALFGKKQSDVEGKPFVQLFASESRAAISGSLGDLTENGVKSVLNQGHEVIGLEANGGLIPLFVTLGRIGNSNRYCAVLRDVTASKRAEEELVTARRNAETASEQKSSFLSRVSHEIREPLNSIIGFSDIMIDERFGPIGNDRYREYLKDINRSGIHVLDIVNDLLDISKIEAGKLELSYEAVDLNQLAGETVALLQPKANDRRIIIRTSLSRAVPKVVADARSIRQIILNLVSNAIKYSERNSQVIVSTTYEENGEVGLRVRDTGEGMTSEQIRNAMEPFVQVSDDRRDRTGSSGLGLPLTKALVEANRAYFELESKPGEGTIAHVQFPSQRVLAD